MSESGGGSQFREPPAAMPAGIQSHVVLGYGIGKFLAK